MPIDSFLRSIDVPVLMVDAHARVVSANTRALAELKRGRTDLEDHLCGEIIECEHSRLPGGCGGTVHCTGCEIRKCVEHTARTGQPSAAVAAVQHSFLAGGVQTRRYSVSTEKRGDAIMLRMVEETD
jgi:hypothetical protein